MTFAQLIEDIRSERKRLNDVGFADARKELHGNIYPMLLDIVETCAREIDEVHAVVVDYFDGADSVIQPALATQIVGTLQLGLTLLEGRDKLTDMEATFQTAALALIPEVLRVSLDEDEDEDEDTDEDESSEDTDTDDEEEDDSGSDD